MIECDGFPATIGTLCEIIDDNMCNNSDIEFSYKLNKKDKKCVTFKDTKVVIKD